MHGWVLRCSFFFLDKPGHQILPVDVGITYALLLGGLALDASALLMIFFSNRAKVYLETKTRQQAAHKRVDAWWLQRICGDGARALAAVAATV
jgi:hypothetical protein